MTEKGIAQVQGPNFYVRMIGLVVWWRSDWQRYLVGRADGDLDGIAAVNRESRGDTGIQKVN